MPPPANDRARLAHQQVLATLQHDAERILDVFPEPEAVMVVVLWDQTLGELPGAVVTTRPEARSDPQVLLRCVSQLAKAASMLAAKIPLQMISLRDAVASMQSELEKLKHEKEADRAGAGVVGGGHGSGPGRPAGQPDA